MDPFLHFCGVVSPFILCLDNKLEVKRKEGMGKERKGRYKER